MKTGIQTCDSLEMPAYTPSEVASYLRIPYQTLKYWITRHGAVDSIIVPARARPPILSFINLLECHVVDAMRRHHRLRLPVIRRAVQTAATLFPTGHPLIDQKFKTDGVDLFVESLGREVINLSKGGQFVLKEILNLYLQRIEFNTAGTVTKFYPFVVRAGADEPKIVSISPSVAFGRSVIDGTGIATAVIAARFRAREPISALAEEYGRSEQEVEEAIRWEASPRLAA
jgi:uncharacterized protein (DUF433 family)